MIYNSLFKANLEYAIVTYGDKIKAYQNNQILKLQKQCLCLICNARRGVHTKKLFESTKIIPSNETFKSETIKFVHKTMNNLTREKQPKQINELILKSNTVKSTRQSNDPYGIHMNQKIPGTIFYNLCRIWNQTKTNLRSCGNTITLKKELKNDILNGLPNCNATNCQTCEIDKHISYE